jgi:hypothetical protein
VTEVPVKITVPTGDGVFKIDPVPYASRSPQSGARSGTKWISN